MTARRIIGLLYLLIVVGIINTDAQQRLGEGVAANEYYSSYDTNFIARVYWSQKYLNTTIGNGDMPKLHYRPNSKFAMGIGATYGWFTLNLSAGLAYLKPKSDERGETKAFDLQGHFYGPRTVIDLFLGHYSGYYLQPEGRGSINGKFYSRPDMKGWQLGFAAYYAFNWRKYSSRAAYLQAAWQHKSAGSLLLGYELYNSQLKGDSALVPSLLAQSDEAKQINQAWHFNMGPGVGYAYTLVLSKHWFASGALTVGIAADWTRESSLVASSRHSFAIRPLSSYKAAIGYNAERFSVSATWANNTIYASGDLGKYAIASGNARLHFAYRFRAGKKFKEYWKALQIPPL